MTFTIAGRQVGAGHPVFVIAEIGNNHNGDFNRALKLIDMAVQTGADCAKFQMRDLKSLYRKKSLAAAGDDLSTEYTLDLLRRFELTEAQHQELAAYSRKKGIIYLCTAWDLESVTKLERI